MCPGAHQILGLVKRLATSNGVLKSRLRPDPSLECRLRTWTFHVASYSFCTVTVDFKTDLAASEFIVELGVLMSLSHLG